MELRPYQRNLVSSVLADFHSHDRLLAVLPTGGGKTVCFVKIAEKCLQTGKRTLVLAHRETLVQQAAKAFAAVGIRAEIEMAHSHASRDAQVVIGSIQTFGHARLTRWPKDHFRLVIVDEAHHSPAASWQKVIDYFTGTKVLYVTATPARTDLQDIGAEKTSYDIGLKDLIDDGWLAPITVATLPVKIDLAAAKVSQGDFQANDAASALAPILDQAAEQIATVAKDRKILVFLPLRRSSSEFADLLTAKGIPSAHVEGGKDAAEIIERFRGGEFQCLTNAMLLTEGFDCPEIDCVVPLRPTKSFPLFCQMTGRGTRLHPGKKDLLLLDFLWQIGRHNPMRPPHLCGAVDAEVDQICERVAKGEDMFAATRDVQAEREAKLARDLAAKSRKAARTFDLRALSQWVGDPNLVAKVSSMPPGPPPSDKQMGLLRRFKVDPAAVPSKAAASALISALMFKVRHP